jgi:uncharacterized damage-inducible protein DinB
MNTITFYTYPTRARQDVWETLQNIPESDLAQPVFRGERFRCIKDLVMHIAAVEDSWLHEDILRDTPVFMRVLPEELHKDGAFFAEVPLETLLQYWREVQHSTLSYLQTNPDLDWVVDAQQQHTAHGLVWHFMLHEVRHTAQIAVVLRQLGHKPPALDLLWYLPLGEHSAQ